jgi:hypothetical protein
MRFKTIAFTLIVSSAVFILGCDDEDSSTIGGGGRLSFQVTLNPPLDSASVSFSAGNTGGILNESTPGIGTVSGFTTDELAVTKGQNLEVFIHVASAHLTDYCSNVQVKALLNGSQFNVRTYNMGGAPTGTNPNTCPDGYEQEYNFIIP